MLQVSLIVFLVPHDIKSFVFFLEIDLSTFSYYIDGEAIPSIQFVTNMVAGVGFDDQTAPWGTKWMGKGAKTGGWFNNLSVFYEFFFH